MKKVLASMLALCLALCLSACGGAASSAAPSVPAQAAAPSSAASSAANAYGTTLEEIKAKGELVIGLDDTFAPMGFRDEKDELVGFDIDLANAVCAELGITATFQPIDWDAKELELSTGKIDCIWNGLSITPEREEKLSLSDPYLNNKIIIMTNEGVEIAEKADLANYKLGTQADSSALEVIMKDEIYASIAENLTEYPTYDEVIMDLQSGRLDAMIVDEVLGQYKNAMLDGVFTTSPVDFGEDYYVIGFRKADTELTDAINAAVKRCVESGKATEISNKWFGADIMVK